ncbi:MAG: hypothetical protein M1835_003277 [Candelina submexicana]|nr:MAG: hypothetical protein M1835_003277 [Candelina submexicana]
MSKKKLMMSRERLILSKKKLLITFDALGTLLVPKQSVAEQYVEVARRHGLENLDPRNVGLSFKKAFRQETTVHPNYGKASGIKPPEWWTNVIKATLHPFSRSLPKRLVPDLLKHFSSSEGYSLYPSAASFFTMLRNKREQTSTRAEEPWPWGHTVVGIITNSDNTVPDILSGFGLDVGTKRFRATNEHAENACGDEDIAFVVLSYDVGVRKPDRLIFDAAKELFKTTLGDNNRAAQIGGALASNKAEHRFEEFDLLHVGDHNTQDVLGAQDAGWNSILLDRKGRYRKDFEQGQEMLNVGIGPSRRRRVDVIQDLNALRLLKAF